ncbi:MAG: glycosyltransferase family 2 protein [Sporichthyaceae bacterium]
MSTPATPPAFGRHVVTAVLVAHNGARWLPQSAAGQRAQTRAPQRFVAVDTGSTDGSAAILVQLLGPDRVVTAPLGTGFGSAVELGVAATDKRYGEAYSPPGDEVAAADRPVQWLWLLHDDAEPELDALEQLLRFVDSSPTVAVAGPKLRGWTNRRTLLEVGVTIARSGRRETGLERREQDQGQHDGVHDVLAVSTAGMLVRRDVWQALGGLDPVLALYRDDVDFGWRVNNAGHRVVCVTHAVVHHAEAATHARRNLAAFPERYLRSDRQHANYVLLANLPPLLVPWAALRLTLGTVLRALGLLVGKLPTNALGEVLALASVLGRPDRLARARWRRRRTRVAPFPAVRPLLASPASSLRRGMEAVSAVVGVGAAASFAAGRHRVVETGPASEDAEDLPSWGSGLARRVLSKPPVVLALALLMLTVVASRDLFGAGRLMGGALLPAPDSAGDLWRTYTEGWHPVGVGSDTAAPPYLAVLASLGTLLFGNVSAAVSLVLLGAVPLSGLTAYRALRRVVASPVLRIWGATTYALLPPVTGAVAAGRVGTAALAILLPVAAGTALRAIRGSSSRGLRAAWIAGSLLAVMSAFAALAYLIAVVLGLGAVASRRLRRPALLRLLVLLVLPPVLLLPWLPALVQHPQLLLLEGGLVRPELVDPSLHPLAVFLLHPGGPGMYPLAFTVGLVLAALAALLRPDRRRLVAAGWATALAGIAAGLALSHTRLDAPGLAGSVTAWPGQATLMAGAGLVLAAVVGAEGARERIARSSFGWRQVAGGALSAAALAVPVLAGPWWALHGADGPVQRRDPVLLPAFVAAEGEHPDRPRTLVLRQRDEGRLSYALLRADGPRLGDADTVAGSDIAIGLDETVADLASGRGGDAAAELLPYGVRFVLLGRPVDPALADAIDAVPGLVRVSAPDRSALWKVNYPSGRVRIVTGPTDTSATVLRSGAVGVATNITAGRGPRLLTLADQRDGRWHATLDGRRLVPRRYDGWAQAFVLPAKGGRLVVSYDDGNRQLLLWLQLAAVVVAIVLSLPSVRAVEEADEAVTGEPPPAHRDPVDGVDPVAATR